MFLTCILSVLPRSQLVRARIFGRPQLLDCDAKPIPRETATSFTAVAIASLVPEVIGFESQLDASEEPWINEYAT